MASLLAKPAGSAKSVATGKPPALDPDFQEGRIFVRVCRRRGERELSGGTFVKGFVIQMAGADWIPRSVTASVG
jgi:hypothetical protein